MTKTHSIAYLISQYPSISHTFILREVRSLRAKGMTVQTASVNLSDRPKGTLDADEVEELESTFFIKSQGFKGALTSSMKALLSSPSSFFKGFLAIFKLAGWNLSQWGKHIGYFAEAAILGDWMTQEGLDHVHVHFANQAATVALITALLYPIGYSITVHGPDEFYDVTLNNLLLKIEHATFLFCISYYTQSQLMKISPPCQWYKFQVARLGVDPDIFSPELKLIKEARPCQILCIGRMVPSKGQHILLIAFDKLIKKNKNIRLNFIGGGPERESLEKEVEFRDLEGKVHFSGALNQSDVIEAYKLADILVLPSFAEGIPVVLMEAMAFQVPCIASCINGIPELIRHNVEGLLVAPSNIEQLAQAIELLISDPELRARLGKAGRERILDKYNLKKNTQFLYHLLTYSAFEN